MAAIKPSDIVYQEMTEIWESMGEDLITFIEHANSAELASMYELVFGLKGAALLRRLRELEAVYYRDVSNSEKAMLISKPKQ